MKPRYHYDDDLAFIPETDERQRLRLNGGVLAGNR
jgi:hypothetical protein